MYTKPLWAPAITVPDALGTIRTISAAPPKGPVPIHAANADTGVKPKLTASAQPDNCVASLHISCNLFVITKGLQTERTLLKAPDRETPIFHPFSTLLSHEAK